MKEERRHKVTFVAIILLASLFTATLAVYPQPARESPLSASDSVSSNGIRDSISSVGLAPQPPLVTRTVRVAIYLETNTTRPSYADIGWLSTNTTGVQRILQAAGCQVTNLTRTDISNHKLMTASFDVFVMVDNLPRENITNLVKEFWLGGGGILSLDSAISYICYAGMIPPESEGSESYGVYWNYLTVYSQVNVTARHPVTKSFSLKTIVTTFSMDWATFSWTALQGTRVAADLIKLGTEMNKPNNVPMVALDPSLKGGRVVQLPCEGSPITSNMSKLIVDSVNWLCPRPKARVLFDLSHRPWYGVDSWDTYCVSPGQYLQFRNALVNRSYTFDKLYPSASGNLTASNLAPYDLLIVQAPTINFTSAEVAAVSNWISGGQSLLALGENPTLTTENENLNYLLSSLSLKIENDNSRAAGTIVYYVQHPTTEGCTSLYIGGSAGGFINYTAPAYVIWGADASNAIIGAQAFGAGRVILTGDIDLLTNTGLTSNSNYQYAINVANWLTASQADVLILIDRRTSPLPTEPNRNFYRGPVANALNDLGISFHLTFTFAYFNKSLHWDSWKLVIVDVMNYFFYTYYSEIIDYLKVGGHLIISDWEYSRSEAIPLNRYLGFEWQNDLINHPPIYVWNSASDVFHQPNLYKAANISTPLDYGYNVDCSNVTLYANASAIAGLGRLASSTNASIVLGVGGRAIANTFLLTEYSSDTDDSTYADSFELWENEIAYMLRPQCSLAPSVPLTMWQGTSATVRVSVSSQGMRAAMQGQVTLVVPAGLGTIQGSATQSFTTPLNPGEANTLAWQVSITGTGSYTLSFSASFKGFKSTSYSASATAGTLAIAQPVPKYFADYGFSIVSNATNFVVDNVSTSAPSGTGAPPTGALGFVFLRMDGTLAPGSHVASVNITYSLARAQQLGLNATTLRFYRWDNSTSQWVALSTTFVALNSTHGLIAIYLTGFSYFAVFGTAPAGQGLAPELLLLVGVVAVVIVVAVVLAVVVMKKRQGSAGVGRKAKN